MPTARPSLATRWTAPRTGSRRETAEAARAVVSSWRTVFRTLHGSRRPHRAEYITAEFVLPGRLTATTPAEIGRQMRTFALAFALLWTTGLSMGAFTRWVISLFATP